MPAINNDFFLAFKVRQEGSNGLNRKTSAGFYVSGVNRAIIMKMHLK